MKSEKKTKNKTERRCAVLPLLMWINYVEFYVENNIQVCLVSGKQPPLN